MAGLLQDSFWFSNVGGFEIGQSLRFRGGQKLQGSVLGVTNRPYTASMWVKFADFTSSNQTVFGREFSTNVSAIEQSVGNLNFREGGNDSSADGVNRDPSAWKHICWTIASGKTSPQTVWINGVEQSLTSGVITQSSSFGWNIGARFNNTAYFNGYIAEVHFIDNQQLNQYSFGQYNDQGVWVPKKYTGTYGGNSFYLDFADPNNIGTDRSGNGNDFTATGFELTNTTSVDYDWYTDSPTTNSALWNPLDGSTRTAFVAANSTAQRTSNTTYGQSVPSIQYSDGKVSYSEHYMGSVGADFGTTPNNYVGVGNYIYGVNSSNQNGFDTGLITYYEDGDIYVDGAFASTGIAYTSNCTIGVKVDRSVTPNTVQFYKDGTASGSASSLGTGDILYGNAYTRNVSNPNLNGNVAWNGGGQPWQYAPSGITEDNAITVKNLPAATIQNPSDHFDVITDTGANILTAAQSKFSNGFWWVKDYVNSNDHQFVDSLRGNNLAFLNPSVNQNQATYVAPSGNSVAWCWKADTLDATALATLNASAGDQDYTAAMSNVTAGFFAGLYTTGATSNGVIKTLPHNLGKSPDWVMATQYTGGKSGSQNYPVTYMSAFDSDSLAGAFYDNGDYNSQIWSYWSTPNVSPATSTTMTVRSSTSAEVSNSANRERTSGDAGDYVIYMWTSVPGYSAFGRYDPNQSADGPFIYTGFAPAFIWLKNSNNNGQDYTMYDSKRSVSNPQGNQLYINTTGAQSNVVTLDFLSNGFKLRSSATNVNGPSTQTMVYAAFAEHPFGGSNVAPATAR